MTDDAKRPAAERDFERKGVQLCNLAGVMMLACKRLRSLQAEHARLAVLMRHDGMCLSETEVRDGLTLYRHLSRKEVRAALLALVSTKRACRVQAGRLTRCTYIASPIGANL